MYAFTGFPKEMVTFYKQLKKNNTKQWFEKHKNEYELYVKKPASEFVIAMGKKLEKLSPHINAIPKVNQSLFRINRDTRFSKDKSPYKTNLGIWFWEGIRKRMECSGCYFHFDENKIMLGVGVYIFPRDLLEIYRKSVVDKKKGMELRQAIEKVSKQGYQIGVKHYKKVPRGFDANHINAEYLLFSGLTAMIEKKVESDFYTMNILTNTFEHFKKMYPIHKWLYSILN